MNNNYLFRCSLQKQDLLYQNFFTYYSQIILDSFATYFLKNYASIIHQGLVTMTNQIHDCIQCHDHPMCRWYNTQIVRDEHDETMETVADANNHTWECKSRLQLVANFFDSLIVCSSVDSSVVWNNTVSHNLQCHDRDCCVFSHA